MPLHPSIVHLPMALCILMPPVAIGLFIAWRRKWLPRQGLHVATILQLALVGSAVVAQQTGEREEDKVEQVLASEAPLEAHEEAAEVFTWAAVGVLGLFALASFLASEKTVRNLTLASIAGTLVVAGLGFRVGHAGGKLVYEEGAANAYLGTVAAPTGAAPSGHHEHDDDD